jgi:DNA end-binding protein Ku
MARPIWKGHISFGLVNVPITLFPAEQRADLSFHLVDTRNSARVRYERVNEVTGAEVPWNKIVKGYEFNDGNYVLLSDKELEGASPELTKTIDIETFVDLEDIDVRYFDKPYYLVPGKGGEKGYVLLREAMERAGKVGIARVVIRSRGNLAALMPLGNSLVLEMLRYHQEVRSFEDFDFPAGDLTKHRITSKELALAEQLIDGLSGQWDPDTFRDEYRDVLLKHIKKRIAEGDTDEVGEVAQPAAEAPRTVNFMTMLKRSLDQSSKAPRRKSKPTGRPARRKTTRKRAS